ncbi:MAG: hypothetical protein ABFD08_09670 [Syntrophomonas sp.]
MDNTNGQKPPEKRMKRMSVSLRPAPTFTGNAAKRLIEMLNNPPDNTEVFKKLEESAKIIKPISTKKDGK